MPIDLLTERDRLLEMYREDMQRLREESSGSQLTRKETERIIDALTFAAHVIQFFEVDAFVTRQGLDIMAAGQYFLIMGGYIHADHIASWFDHQVAYARLRDFALIEVDGGWQLQLPGTRI